MIVNMNTKVFTAQMNNIVNYSFGFLEGVQKGKKVFLETMSENMTVPFYNKAKIMENGIPVTISPTRGQALKFNGPTGEVFTRKPIKVESPGGDEVFGSFESTVDIFISRYFKQSFIRASGLYDYIKKPKLYKTNFKAGSKMGKSKGVETGFKWIANATIGVE